VRYGPHETTGSDLAVGVDSQDRVALLEHVSVLGRDYYTTAILGPPNLRLCSFDLYLYD